MTPLVTLNDGSTIPQLGFGVWQVPDDEATAAVLTALDVGYRSVDTAAVYANEVGTGKALAQANLPRADIYLTTKLWNDDQGYDTARAAFDASLARLGTDYLDLYLIHWPKASEGKFVDSWKALVQLKNEGRVKSIGVSNFTAANLEVIIGETGVAPALNQIELHPAFNQAELRAKHSELGIVTEAWSPLGQGTLMTDPTLVAIAAAHKVTTAQVILAWHLALGNVVIPKSVTPARIAENFDVFTVGLTEEDITRISALSTPGGRIGPDPDSF